MKKLFAFILCTILCTAFSLTATALSEQERFDVSVNFNSSSGYDSIPNFVVPFDTGKEIGDTPFYFSFPQERRNGITWYYAFHFNIDDFVYDADTQTITKSDGGYFNFYYCNMAIEDSDLEHSSGTGYGNIRAKSIKFNGSFDAERFTKNTNMHIKNLERFDANEPPDPFTYSISPNNFTRPLK